MRASVERILAWGVAEPGETLSERLGHHAKSFIIRTQPHLRIRYAPVIRRLDAIAAEVDEPRILEVGSGSLGVTRFWRHPVTGVDLKFDGPKLPYLRPILASAERLPFDDDSFDAVVCVDVLEHLPTWMRRLAVREMMRVAKGEVIVGVPCGETAERCEAWGRLRCKQAADRASDKRRDQVLKRSAFLAEHGAYGVPREEPTKRLFTDYASEEGLDVIVETFGNEPAWFWKLMLPGVVPMNPVSRWFSRIAGVMIEPFAGRAEPSSPYRTFFHAIKYGEQGWLQ